MLYQCYCSVEHDNDIYVYALPCCSLGDAILRAACIIAIGMVIVTVGAGVTAGVRLETANVNSKK